MKLKEILKKVVEEQGSDLHLRANSIPRVRIDGQLYDMEGYIPQEAEMKQFLYEMLTKSQIEQFERFRDLDFSFSIEGLCRIRANLFSQRGVFCAAIRVIPTHIPTVEEIYLPKIVNQFLTLNKGLVLVTGPTGCGKSTTLAAMVDYINKKRRSHIVTIEDPIEYIFEDKLSTVSQREIPFDSRSFKAALRHVFRQDPDIVMIGEMRDLETMQIALTLAETGHLTFSTLHTSDSSETINRIIDSFPPHQQPQVRMQLMVSLEGIISQQLLPLKGKRGRVAAREVLICNRAIKNLIREGKTHQINSAIQTGADEGMITMSYSLGVLYEKGMISYETAMNSSWDKKAFVAKYPKDE